MTVDITRPLAGFASGLDLSAIDPAVVERTGLLMLDLSGSIIRARHEAESTPALLAAVAALGLSGGDANVLGDPDAYSPFAAALLNGALGHSLDFDDTHALAILHPGATVIPAALAAAQMRGASGRRLVEAIIAGYEVALRLALALPAGAHYARGFHPSATCGAFGAAAAAGHIHGLDTEAMTSAFGIALSQSAGSLQFLANGAWTKRFQVGWAAAAGLMAATLAAKGFVGASAPLEGKHGFLNAYSDAPEPLNALIGLGENFELMRVGLKPYPSCRWGHAGIDAALALRSELALKVEDIVEVQFGLSRAALLLIGEPSEHKQRPVNIVEGQFSGPFVIATALTTGRMGWTSYAGLSDPVVMGLAERVICEHDEEIEAEFPRNMAGKLTLETKQGRFERKVVVPKGEPDNFLSAEEVRAKFDGLVDGGLEKDDGDALAKHILGVHALEDIAVLFTGRRETGGNGLN